MFGICVYVWYRVILTTHPGISFISNVLVSFAKKEVIINPLTLHTGADVDQNSGKKSIQYWQQGGHANINSNFVRLTADLQSKRGYLFNTADTVHPDWTALLRFRISGSGQRLFGDGMALWFTNRRHFEPGFLLGSTDRFMGFGILFDTFRNDEANHVHKDISFVASNGVDEVILDGNRPGCDGDFRYGLGGASGWVIILSCVFIFLCSLLKHLQSSDISSLSLFPLPTLILLPTISLTSNTADTGKVEKTSQ